MRGAIRDEIVCIARGDWLGYAPKERCVGLLRTLWLGRASAARTPSLPPRHRRSGAEL